MITNENFLEESKKFISQKVSSENLFSFLQLVEKFQAERLERLTAQASVKNDLFSQYLSPALNEIMENQNSKEQKFFFESIAQNYTTSILIATKYKIIEEFKSSPDSEKVYLESIKNKSINEIEKLLNIEKKNGHKFHTVIHDYIRDSQEFLYDNEKLALKGRSMPSIEERVKEIQKHKDEKKFNVQELDHPKLDAQAFEREMKLLLSGDRSENQINGVLKRVEEFQLGFIGALKKKINNPTGATEKLLPNIPETIQLKALKDWAWEEESVNVMDKVLKIIKKTAIESNLQSFEKLNVISEGLESLMLDIGSLKKYNPAIKNELLENLSNLKVENKTTSILKI